ncbi:MAG: homocysteine S-methyltransferase family protein [Candidatus Eisenbacteria bacterium]|uniref:Homocysteine S-methyltransferase family protein n=1 Tax=Eiseniibacteriota bacterium TaxID=2212470 RepID=A0A948WEE0_UNCEI|nr:homocysteine S-methyltransferase family protein [Candidatus Eisenbacteria bacterium]MBU2692678.1 homocysteine S-methyltransferase family protein [Candidatus Eisenbacteria bacterium]
MSFVRALTAENVILTEGAIIERLRRNHKVNLNPNILHAGFLFEKQSRCILEACYREYVEIAHSYHLPIIIGTPTWRANPERLQADGRYQLHAVHDAAAAFLRAVRDDYPDHSNNVYIAGMLGCRGDAYDPRDALEIDEAKDFHGIQVHALAASGVDFLLAATLPASSEALGIAHAMDEFDLPYILSFVIHPSGTLPDGTLLHDIINDIDAQTEKKPLCYWVNCVHPSNFEKAMRHINEHSPAAARRIMGLQANTSTLTPEELDNSPALHEESPDVFGELMWRIHKNLGIKILGGCCGTDPSHISSLAQLVRRHKA